MSVHIFDKILDVLRYFLHTLDNKEVSRTSVGEKESKVLSKGRIGFDM